MRVLLVVSSATVLFASVSLLVTWMSRDDVAKVAVGVSQRLDPDGYLRWSTAPAGRVDLSGTPPDVAPDYRTTREMPGAIRFRVDVGPEASAAGFRVVAEPLRFRERGWISCVDEVLSTDTSTLTTSLLQGSYMISVVDHLGRTASTPIAVRGGCDNGECILSGQPTRRVRLVLHGSTADAVASCIVAGPHLRLSTTSEAVPENGWIVVVVPATRETRACVLDDRGQVLQVARIPVGASSLRVYCPPISRQQGVSVHGEMSVYCELLGGRLRSWLAVPGKQGTPAGAAGQFVCFSGSVAPYVQGSPRVTLQFRAVHATVEREDGEQPWLGVRLDVTRLLTVLGKRTTWVVSTGVGDATGRATVTVPVDAAWDLHTHDDDAVQRGAAAKDAVPIVVRGQPTHGPESWYFGVAHRTLRIVMPKRDEVVRASDAFGFVQSPVPTGTPAILAAWPGRTRSEPASVEYVSLSSNLRPWVVADGLVKRRLCSFHYAGDGQPPIALAVAPVGWSWLDMKSRRLTLTDTRRVRMGMLRRGASVLCTEEVEDRVVSVRRVSVLGGARAQVIRYAQPNGGLSLEGMEQDAEVLLFTREGGEWVLLWRSGTPTAIEVLLLEDGEYFVHVSSRTEVHSHSVHRVQGQVVSFNRATIPGCQRRISVHVTEDARIPFSAVRFKDRTTEETFIVKMGRDGSLDLVWPRNELEIAAVAGAANGPLTVVPASTGAISVQVLLVNPR